MCQRFTLELIGPGVNIGGIAGTQIVEAQRRHAECGSGFSERAHTAVCAERLVTERLADPDTHTGRHLHGGQMQPGEELVLCGCKVQRHGRSLGSRDAR
jgi:hypothetical protein